MQSSVVSAPSTSTPTVTITNSRSWTANSCPDLALSLSKRCHLKPHFSYSINGLNASEFYKIHLEIGQADNYRYQFQKDDRNGGQYVQKGLLSLADHPIPAPQTARIPKHRNSEWVKGIELENADFSDLFFTKKPFVDPRALKLEEKKVEGTIRLETPFMYMPTLVVESKSGGYWRFPQEMQKFICVSSKKREFVDVEAGSSGQQQQPRVKAPPAKRSRQQLWAIVPQLGSMAHPQFHQNPAPQYHPAYYPGQQYPGTPAAYHSHYQGQGYFGNQFNAYQVPPAHFYYSPAPQYGMITPPIVSPPATSPTFMGPTTPGMPIAHHYYPPTSQYGMVSPPATATPPCSTTPGLPDVSLIQDTQVADAEKKTSSTVPVNPENDEELPIGLPSGLEETAENDDALGDDIVDFLQFIEDEEFDAKMDKVEKDS
ncbi:hypothetical protein CAEBREN_05558 [Caenorhabditis brenneri]|uniref:T-box domain-containing protein n=1 Tax=Caenorhabditis brenneri TaxID=135651 RepID=G0MMX3_CAEBE|nr:hypothetical protein CAEBREN_05558 [Caenorhabditis brenneri]